MEKHQKHNTEEVRKTKKIHLFLPIQAIKFENPHFEKWRIKLLQQSQALHVNGEASEPRF